MSIAEGGEGCTWGRAEADAVGVEDWESALGGMTMTFLGIGGGVDALKCKIGGGEGPG